uniref:Phospholipase A2 n=1 Tax=Paramormyrops kingsleyae TaxID=1676925 RepID=A0A3B3QQT5_9TELE
MVSLSWAFVQITKMKTLQTFFMLASSLSIVMMDPDYRSLLGLRDMIICKIPSSWPLLDYGDYGCYCGKGGAGTAVDDLDRCCQTHDHCYHQAKNLEACWPVLENPYTLPYSYSCDKANKTITCKGKCLCRHINLTASCEYVHIQTQTHTDTALLSSLSDRVQHCLRDVYL